MTNRQTTGLQTQSCLTSKIKKKPCHTRLEKGKKRKGEENEKKIKDEGESRKIKL